MNPAQCQHLAAMLADALERVMDDPSELHLNNAKRALLLYERARLEAEVSE
jgi:3-dehydroquinate dehydratase